MCGIAGFIGKATNPKVSFQLLQSLLLKTEHRGPEATGFWGCQSGVDGKLIYQKEPIKASEFIKRPMWEFLGKFNPSLLISHCREPTMTGGTGSPKINKNNHPHISEDMNVALIHNGKVEEYQSLKSDATFRGTTFSECDSEMILRIFERGELFRNEEKLLAERYPDLAEKDIAHRIYGIEQIFRKLNNGAMAVAIGERHNPGTRRSLWLFRDDKRPLHIIDLRSSLGQIWFCSTVPIWRDAVEACPEAKAMIPKDHSILGIPPLMVYLFETDEEQPDTESKSDNHNVWKSHWRYRKFKIERSREPGEEPVEVLPANIKQGDPKPPLECISMLNNADEITDKFQRFYTGSDNGVEVVGAINTVSSAIEDGHESRPSGIEMSTALLHTDIAEEDTVLEPTDNPLVAATEVTDDDPVVEVTFSTTPPTPSQLMVTEEPMSYDLAKLTTAINAAKEKLDNINTSTYNLAMEGSLDKKGFQDVLDDMEQVNTELAGTQFALKK